MTLEQIEKLIESEEIESDLDIKNNMLIALQTLSKYCDDVGLNPGHDQVWATLDEEGIEKMSDEDVRLMLKLGWFIDEEAWSTFC